MALTPAQMTSNSFTDLRAAVVFVLLGYLIFATTCRVDCQRSKVGVVNLGEGLRPVAECGHIDHKLYSRYVRGTNCLSYDAMFRLK